MMDDHNSALSIATTDTLFPKRVHRLRQWEVFFQAVGVTAAIVRHGLQPTPDEEHIELGLIVIVAMAAVTASIAVRHRWSLARSTFMRQHLAAGLFSLSWMAGLLAILLFGPILPDWQGVSTNRGFAIIACSELFILLHGAAGVVALTRRAASGGVNPALVLVLSFVVLIAVGTLLLMLPRARPANADEESLMDRARVALFTSTSASCVTGLVVVDTGSEGEKPYWSRTGQIVILCLFQIGGLGIMTWGALFAVIAGRQMQLRESVTLGDILESEGPGGVRRLLLTILCFTIGAELIGALLLSGLWSDLPLGDRIFYSLFHSTSAFCNAGFALTDDSFVGMSTRWQVWGAMSGLIITGGLGFAVLYNIALYVRSKRSVIQTRPLFSLPQNHVRVSITSKLVVGTTVALLLFGAVGYYVLEALPGSDGADYSVESDTSGKRIADAWFQSVTFRTAGFNTVDHGAQKPATKLFAIPLMIIGASPGSTGGGVKTISFALAVLALASVLRGRERVEFMGRTIPDEQVRRALAILTLGVMIVMAATILLVLFERQPDLLVESQPDFLVDLLYEATSAFATVGVSTGVTRDLSPPSQIVIMITMFIGRVGPLTLLMGLGGRHADARYDYPFERVTLG